MNSRNAPARYPLARPVRLSPETVASRCGVHPDRIRQYVALGLLPATRDAEGRLWLEPAQLAAIARIERLRSGLALNYSALGLVLDLLDRITVLEAALRAQQIRTPRRSPPPWT
jgi:DNA-binding transcriptional MerR regulator